MMVAMPIPAVFKSKEGKRISRYVCYRKDSRGVGEKGISVEKERTGKHRNLMKQRGKGDSLYIHTSLGSVAVGAKAIPIAEPKAV